jgi:uncharacterized protein YjbJ (UPF0337 family)
MFKKRARAVRVFCDNPFSITHGGGYMNSDNIKGTLDDAAGRAKRQVGEWTGDTGAQADGAAQQVKGKVEKVVGNVRDAVNNATDRSTDRSTTRDIDDNLDKETIRNRE